jgi:hypothetical protein
MTVVHHDTLFDVFSDGHAAFLLLEDGSHQVFADADAARLFALEALKAAPPATEAWAPPTAPAPAPDASAPSAAAQATPPDHAGPPSL